MFQGNCLKGFGTVIAAADRGVATDRLENSLRLGSSTDNRDVTDMGDTGCTNADTKDEDRMQQHPRKSKQNWGIVYTTLL